VIEEPNPISAPALRVLPTPKAPIGGAVLPIRLDERDLRLVRGVGALLRSRKGAVLAYAPEGGPDDAMIAGFLLSMGMDALRNAGIEFIDEADGETDRI